MCIQHTYVFKDKRWAGRKKDEIVTDEKKSVGQEKNYMRLCWDFLSFCFVLVLLFFCSCNAQAYAISFFIQKFNVNGSRAERDSEKSSLYSRKLHINEAPMFNPITCHMFDGIRTNMSISFELAKRISQALSIEHYDREHRTFVAFATDVKTNFPHLISENKICRVMWNTYQFWL